MMATIPTFGQRLRAARTRARLSQTDLETSSGIPKSRLSRYENDHVLPSLASVRKLAGALSIPESELVDQNESPWETFNQDLREGGVSITDSDDAHGLAGELMKTFPLQRRSHAPAAPFAEQSEAQSEEQA